MAYESIKVDIIPGAENAEVLHFSQYDNKRPFFIELFNGGAEFIPESGMSLTLECRKRDGNIVILSDPVMNDNVAEFSTTEQLTACYGDNEAEIKIVDDNDLVIGSANFIINVEKSPTCGGLVSESEIDNLTQQIEDITQQVIGDDYYNKTETDALLADKADISDIPDMSNYYTKAQTYSSSQIDTALSYKSDRSELNDYALKDWVELNFVDAAYLGTHYYNKNAVDNLLFNLLPVGRASGNPCSFDTEIAGKLVSLTANIVCGGGGGTPSTPIPLVGHSELNLDVNGDTFTVAFGQTVYGGVYDKSGRLTITWGRKVYDGSDDENWSDYNSGYDGCSIRDNEMNVNSLNPSTQLKGNIAKTNTNRGNATSLSGVILKTYASVDDGAYFFICGTGATSKAELRTFLASNPLEIAYTLATPIVIDVPSISVFAENGVNNIVSDCGGDVNVSYKDTIQHYIDSRL